MDRKYWLTVNFSEPELHKLEEAAQYSLLSGGVLVKVLLKNGLDEFSKNEQQLTFIFDKNKKFGREAYKSKAMKLDPMLYTEMEEICNCTPFSMSSLAKYLVMPQIDQIIEKKGWNYKP